MLIDDLTMKVLEEVEQVVEYTILMIYDPYGVEVVNLTAAVADASQQSTLL